MDLRSCFFWFHLTFSSGISFSISTLHAIAHDSHGISYISSASHGRLNILRYELRIYGRHVLSYPIINRELTFRSLTVTVLVQQ